MSKKFMVYAKGDIEENDITIECNDEDDMNVYAKACIQQGYKEVTTSTDKRKQLLNEIDGSEKLCGYCPLPEGSKGVHYHGSCEGSRCEQAAERYLEEMEDEEG